VAVTKINLNGINELDLDLPGTTTATISAGVVSVTNTGVAPTGIELQTDGVDNGSQTKLNLVAGPNVTLVDDGTGDVTIASTGGGSYSLGGVVNNANLTLGPGAGSGATSSVLGFDGSHAISILTGTFPVAEDTLWTLTFTDDRGHTVYPVISSGIGTPFTSADQAVGWNGSSTSAFYVVESGATGLQASSSYLWTVSCP
jgi:hypothetical protein